MKTSTLILIGLIAGALLFLIVAYAPPSPSEPVTKEPVVEGSDFEINERPTDFARIGTVVFNNPGLKPRVPYLIYEEAGKPALTKEIIIDELSVCSASNGATPCVAMSVTLDVPFHGKRALVEGIQSGDGVLLRKLQVIPEGQPELIKDTGDVFISWPHAVSLIKNCEVEMLMQTHALDVYLDLKEGNRVRAVESVIDEVFRVYNESIEKCGNIPIATE